MRNKTISGVILLLLLSILMSCHGPGGDTHVEVKDSDDSYEFYAYYPSDKTNSVEKFVNKSISPDRIYGSGDEVVDLVTTLRDRTTFHIKSRNGRIRIRVDKNENSGESLQRVREMCNGIKEILVSASK